MFDTIPKEDGIIVVCLTSAVSGTYNGAALACKESGRKDCFAIDSHSTAIGMRQMVQDGLEYIEQGLPFDVVKEKMLDVARRNHTCFSVPTLDYLYRGGRIGRAANIVGSILSIKPIIYVNKENQIDVLDKPRTTKKAIERMVKWLHDNSPCKRIGIVHIENEEEARKLQARVQAEYPDVPVTVRLRRLF